MVFALELFQRSQMFLGFRQKLFGATLGKEETDHGTTTAIDTKNMDVCTSVSGTSRPSLKPIGIPIKISEGTQSAYDVIDSLTPGSKVVFGFDYSPGNAAEMEPQAIAILKHLLTKDVKVIGLSFQAQGPMLAVKAFEAAGWTEKEYGTDLRTPVARGAWRSGQ